MRKTITLKWLKSKGACRDGVEWFKIQKTNSANKIIVNLKKEKYLDWLNWLIVRLMKYKQYVSYAVYAAEQVLYIYEKKHPDDNRPRLAIEAAKKCIKNNTKKNRSYAAAAAAATYAATYAVAATYAAAAAATYAATYAAAAAATYAADAATYAAARNKMKLKIINYGIRLLNK